MEKHQRVSILSTIVLVGFALSAGYHYVQGAYLGRGYPYDTFLCNPAGRGSDFSDVLRDGHTLQPYLQYSSAQYPLMALIGFLLYPLGSLAYPTFLLFVLAAFTFFSAASVQVAKATSTALPVFAIAFLSYPFLFAVDRGNFELLVFVLLLGFMYFFTRGRYSWSAICLGLAIALKLYPVILLAVYFPAGKTRSALLAVAVAATATLGSLMCFKGGLAANASFLLQGDNFRSNALFREFTSFSSPMVQRGVTLLTFIKWFSIETGFIRGMGDTLFLSRYLAASALIGVVAVVYAVFVEQDLWKRVAVLVLVMLLLPPLSADYKLLLLYVPLYLFVESDKPSRLDPAYLAVFGLLLVPKSYYYLSSVFSESGAAHDISIAVPLNVLLLIALSLLIGIPGLVNRFRRAPGSPIPLK